MDKRYDVRVYALIDDLTTSLCHSQANQKTMSVLVCLLDCIEQELSDSALKYRIKDSADKWCKIISCFDKSFEEKRRKLANDEF